MVLLYSSSLILPESIQISDDPESGLGPLFSTCAFTAIKIHKTVGTCDDKILYVTFIISLRLLHTIPAPSNDWDDESLQLQYQTDSHMSTLSILWEAHGIYSSSQSSIWF